MQLKVKFLLILSFIISFKSNSQNLKGVYTLFNNSVYYYINFQNNNFELISLIENPSENEKVPDVLKVVGSGTFIKKATSINLYFNNKKTSFNFISNDSMNYSMYSDTMVFGREINIQLQFSNSSFNASSLIIKTPHKSYNYSFKQNKLSLILPDSLLIENMILYSIKYTERYLPYKGEYNVHNYNYFLKENIAPPTIIQNDFWNLSITNTKVMKGNLFFTLKKPSYFLTKTDALTINYLKSLNNERLKSVLDRWYK